MYVSPEVVRQLDAELKASLQSLRDGYFAELLFWTVVVAVGVVVEEIEYFISWRSVKRLLPISVALPAHRLDTIARRASKVGWFLIVAGVAGEGIYEARVSQADGLLQDFNSILSLAQASEIAKLGDITATARIDAEKASNAALGAVNKSNTAARSAAAATSTAREAESHLRDALVLAESAANEAKGYSAQIVDAKKDAAEAKSLVAEIRQLSEEARKRSADVAETVSKLKSKRALTDKGAVVVALDKFRDTEYGFEAVNGDTDSTELLADIDRILSRAGWKRVDQPGGLSAINIPVDEQRISVAQLPRSGIQIRSESTTALSLLESFAKNNHRERLPRHIAAALLLREVLYLHISPKEDALPDPVNIQLGESATVLISVGSKRQ